MTRVTLRRHRPLRALQIEVTSRCTRSCALCPRSALADRWRDGELSERTWRSIEPALPMAAHVHLQGWGEPLLHPRLPEMAAAAKRAGCSVGLTTNGDLLPGATDWILDLELDMVTVSVAGLTKHCEFRDGSVIGDILKAAAELAAGDGHIRRPHVQLSYLLTRENYHELADLVSAAAALGIPEVFAIHLDCTPTPELAALSGFGPDGLDEGIAEAMNRASRLAALSGIVFRPAPAERQDLLVCALDPTRLAFVSWDGRVGPCTYLLLPVEGAIPRASLTEVRDVEPVVYGSLGETDLVGLLEGPGRARFIQPLAARLRAEGAFLEAGSFLGFGSQAIRELDEADRQRSATLAANPFPAGCAACPKAEGW